MEQPLIAIILVFISASLALLIFGTRNKFALLVINAFQGLKSDRYRESVIFISASIGFLGIIIEVLFGIILFGVFPTTEVEYHNINHDIIMQRILQEHVEGTLTNDELKRDIGLLRIDRSPATKQFIFLATSLALGTFFLFSIIAVHARSDPHFQRQNQRLVWTGFVEGKILKVIRTKVGRIKKIKDKAEDISEPGLRLKYIRSSLNPKHQCKQLADSLSDTLTHCTPAFWTVDFENGCESNSEVRTSILINNFEGSKLELVCQSEVGDNLGSQLAENLRNHPEAFRTSQIKSFNPSITSRTVLSFDTNEILIISDTTKETKYYEYDPHEKKRIKSACAIPLTASPMTQPVGVIVIESSESGYFPDTVDYKTFLRYIQKQFGLRIYCEQKIDEVLAIVDSAIRATKAHE